MTMKPFQTFSISLLSSLLERHLACGLSRSLLLLLLVLSLAACATQETYQIELMPAPDIYEAGVIDPFADEDPVENVPYTGILYATDRAPASEEDQEVYYRNKRGHVLRLGVAEMKLGDQDITWEEARRISLLKNRTDKYPLQVTEVDEFGVLDDTHMALDDPALLDADPKRPARRFAEAINEKLAASQKKDVYVYVHGYKVIFENPVLVATELWHFLGYEGAFIAYAWPSTPSRWAYVSDIETAVYTARNLRILLAYLARETDAERIHIVGYSAGTRVVITALNQLALMHAELDQAMIQEKYRLGHVILVGSDFDRDIIGIYLEDGLLRVSDDFTIYLSGTDKALGASQFLTARERLGQMWKEGELDAQAAEYIRANRDLILIDVTDAEAAAAGNGHAYFRKSPWVSSDVLMTLMHNLPPSERGLVRGEDSPIWGFPADYITRLKTKLIELKPEFAKPGVPPAQSESMTPKHSNGRN